MLTIQTRCGRLARNIFLALAALLPVLAPAQDPGMAPPPPPEVTVVAVEPRNLPVSFDFVGTTQASKVVEIRARVNGFLEERQFEEGTVVEQGAVIFKIDPLPLQADKEIDQARVDQAKSRVRLAEQEVKRLQSVTVPGAIAQADLDQKLAEQSSASGALRLAEAELAKTELELGYTTVEAPITGFIGKAMKEIGSVVDPNANSLLAVMHQVDPIYVSFEVSEREYLAWRSRELSGEISLNGDPAPYLEITLLNQSLYEHRGTLDFEGVAMNPQTGTVELRATFPNPDGALKVGQFVKAHVRGYTRPNTLAVPQRAVSQSPQGPYVYVVGEDNLAQMRPIAPGDWSGQEWVINEGLRPGDQVIVEGLSKVMPGAPVAPVPARQPLAQAK